MSCISRDRICFLNGRVGRAMEAWYHILDKTRDLATRTLPRKDRERVARDLVRGVILMIRDCHRDVILLVVSGRMKPRVLMGPE